MVKEEEEGAGAAEAMPQNLGGYRCFFYLFYCLKLTRTSFLL